MLLKPEIPDLFDFFHKLEKKKIVIPDYIKLAVSAKFSDSYDFYYSCGDMETCQSILDLWEKVEIQSF